MQQQEAYWESVALADMTVPQWEALCDGCGLCCLMKLEDFETGEVAYTKVACQLLNVQTCTCTDYPERHKTVPDCLQLTPALVPQLKWLPNSCAYRLISKGQPLPHWHHLISGSRSMVHQHIKSAAGRCISEKALPKDIDLEDYVVRWVKHEAR